MSGSFALERPLHIGFLGPDGSYSHQAAEAKFGASVEYDNLADIPMIFDAVHRRDIDYGLVPIENSTEGSVVVTLDALGEVVDAPHPARGQFGFGDKPYHDSHFSAPAKGHGDARAHVQALA